MRLHDLNIVITRPHHQNRVLEEKCRTLGLQCITFPCIEIAPIKSSTSNTQLPHSLSTFDVICFTSPNAVIHGMNTFPELSALTAQTQIAAVGESSAQKLRELGFNDVLTPTTTTDTEGLLATLDQQPLAGKKVLIIKGMGGRELLKQALQTKHCEVYACDVYERVCPQMGRPLPKQIDVILFTSSESAENFTQLNSTEENPALFNCQTIVGHPKISDKVTSLGFKKPPIIAASPTDEDMYLALQDWLASIT